MRRAQARLHALRGLVAHVPLGKCGVGAPLASLLGFANDAGVGNYGIEGYYNKSLHGQDGFEATVRDLERALADGDLYRDAERVRETMKAFEETKAKLVQLYEHWDEAAELN